jgi:hypothetical protein
MDIETKAKVGDIVLAQYEVDTSRSESRADWEKREGIFIVNKITVSTKVNEFRNPDDAHKKWDSYTGIKYDLYGCRINAPGAQKGIPIQPAVGNDSILEVIEKCPEDATNEDRLNSFRKIFNERNNLQREENSSLDQ